MKHKINSLVGSIVLMLILLISTATPAFAADAKDTWVVKDSMSTPRSSFKTVVVDGKIYAISGNDTNLSTVEVYDPAADMWTPRASLSIRLFDFEAQVINGKIYLIGGVNSEGTQLSTVEEYDPITNKWANKASMKISRAKFQTEVIDGKIYAIGGYNSKDGSLSSVEEYNPETNIWTTKQSMSFERERFQAETIDDKIYVFGGINSSVTTTVEEYDSALNKWSTKAPMPITRTDFKTNVINNKIFIIGGYSGGHSLSIVEEYDPVSNVYTTKKPMSCERMDFESEVIGEKIYVMRGYSITNTTGITKYLFSFEMYNAKTDTWETKASMSASGYAFQTEVLNGKIYAMGGFYNGQTLSLVEEYNTNLDPTLTLTASSKKVKVGQQFTTSVDIHNVTNICAEDIKITYDKDLFTYAGAEAQTGLKIYKEDTSIPGTIRFISACEGKDNAATGDKGLITLKFTAKKEGTGKVDIIKGRIADNSTLEMDVADENCGEDTITVEGYSDVNRNGEFTLLDLGIDGWYNGMNAADTDTTKFSADVVADGKIDDNDLAEITKGILANSNYQPNNA